jgi:hypothetical protein
MNHDILIIPILIDGAKLPEKDNVPDALIKLLDFRSLQLRTIFWSENMDDLLEYLEEELSFIKEAKRKLTESLEVNYQRLPEIDVKNPKKGKVGLESSDLMQVRKMIKAETIFSQKHVASPMEKRKNMRCR